MRVLLATTSGAGHFVPMLPFGAALRRAGHEVLVAEPESFVGFVERAGYPCWPCADIASDELAALHEEISQAPPEDRNARAGKIFAGAGPRAILPRMLAAFDEWRPDLLLREIGEFGSLLAAELRGVPQAQVLVGLDKFTEQLLPVAAGYLAPLRETVGLPPDPAGERLTAGPALSLLPLSYEEGPSSRPVHRFRDVAPAEVDPLPAWWPNERDPLVYVTFGTVSAAVPFAGEAFRKVVGELAGLPVRLLVTTGDGGASTAWSTLPPTAHVERWVPQSTVLPQATAMVCHGGMGTVLGALAFGVPLVVVPQFADQHDNAARVSALGAGLTADPDSVRDAVLRVLYEESFRTGAQRIAAEIAALPPADEAVELLRGLSRPGGSPG